MRRREFCGSLLGGATLIGMSGLSAAADSPKTKHTAPRKCVEKCQTSVLVCGGGPAGVAAATMAARGGARVLLVERYGRLGGMAVQGMVGPLMGNSNSVFLKEMIDRLGKSLLYYEKLDLEYATMVQESGAGLLLHAWAAEAMVEHDQLVGARLLTKGGTIEVRADITIDATGDGDIAWMAGAPFELGRDGDGRLQPMSIMYSIGGVDESRMRNKDNYAFGTERHLKNISPDQMAPDVKAIAEAQASGELPATVSVIRIYLSRRPGERIINATQINEVDGTSAEDLTRAELEGRRQAYQIAEFLRKHEPGFENSYISAMPAVIGVRETRRILGERYLTRDDVASGRTWPDAVVQGADFPIDIHNPAGAGQAEEESKQVKPYDIPYGCLVPRNMDGLLVAGRCISGSHEAHASYRVQCICLSVGAAAGAAAALAAKARRQPREVHLDKLQEILGVTPTV